MSQSFVRQVEEQEKRYIGFTQIFSGALSTVQNASPSPFVFDININRQIPQPETSVVHLVVSGEPYVDAENLISYSGQFKIRRNPSAGTPSIYITGDSLSTSQISVIQNAMSIVETSSPSGLDSISDITFNLSSIALAGARYFEVNIPYDDNNFTRVVHDVSIPFLSFDASDREPNYINDIIVRTDNNELTIDAGIVEKEISTILLEPNYSSTRNVTSIIVNYSGSNFPDDNITINYTESLDSPSRHEGIKIIPNSIDIPLLPSSDENGFTTTANYNVRILTDFWKENKGYLFSIPSDVHTDTNIGRLAYDIKYGIGKIVGSDIQPERMFSFGVKAKTSCNVSIVNDLLTVYINDFGSSTFSRSSFVIVNNYTRPFTRINLHIDSSGDPVDNYFKIYGYDSGGIPRVFTFSGFLNGITDNSTTINDFIQQVKDEISSTYPEWHTTLNFVINDIYKYGKISEVNSGSPSSPDVDIALSVGEQSSPFYVNPFGIGTSFTATMPIGSSTFLDIENWLASTFGSYGLVFDWNIPDVTEWKSLPFYPVVYDGSNLATVALVNGGVLTPLSMYSRVDCFFSINKNSSIGQEYNNNGSDSFTAIVVNANDYTKNLFDVASEIETRLNTIISDNFTQVTGGPSLFSVSCQIDDYYSSLPYANIYKSPALVPGVFSFYPSFVNPSTVSGFSRYQVNDVSTFSIGNTISSSYSKISLTGTIDETLTIILSSTGTLGDLIDTINNENGIYFNLIKSSLIDSSYAVELQSNISTIDSRAIPVNGSLHISSTVNSTDITRYPFSRYNTLSLLVDAIRLDWNTNIDVQISAGTNIYSDAIPSNLIEGSYIEITTDPLPKYLNGTVRDLPDIVAPTALVKIRMTVAFASGGGGDPNEFYGIQVGLGGYEKNGILYINEAPNQFYEPVYNSISSIQFSATEADVIYLLVRTRKGVSSPSYTSVPEHYSGLIKYSNGYTPYSIMPYIPDESRFIDAWDQGDGEIPTVIAVPVYASLMDVTIEDNYAFDSINLSIINKPSELDQFGFLAINRTNSNKSQTKSKVGKTFGLVLDNRGSWDILISPEAYLSADSSGSLSHLGSFYKREIFDDDEGFTFSITTDLPSEIASSISISPMANSPQVWILRIEYGVKKYLQSLVSSDKTECFINIDLLVTGRSSGVQGTARVVIYYDYTCVYNVGLCDYFWNLIDPPKVITGPEIIQNRINVTYKTLVDCDNLTTPTNDNVLINAPLLLSVSNIPTFKNGTALFLVKSSYTSEIQGFYYPTGNELDRIQYSNCSPINANLPFIQKLNKEFLLLPGSDTPINNISEIRSLINTENSYLWVKPQFQFPSYDKNKDCNANEIVIVGIGYTFKNWNNGTRKDDILIGSTILFPNGVYSSPEINFCYRYYYNQKET